MCRTIKTLHAGIRYENEIGPFFLLKLYSSKKKGPISLKNFLRNYIVLASAIAFFNVSSELSESFCSDLIVERS